jgi:phage gp45-like
MSGSPKEKLHAHTGEETAEEATEETTGDAREVYLRDGRKLRVTDEGREQLVEIRNESGMLELRIKLTEDGPVLQMESVKLSLKASESVEIESPRVEIKGTEQLELKGGQVTITGEEDVTDETKGQVRIAGKMIWLN